MKQYLQHPLSAAFPSMGDAEFQALKDSVEVSGVLNDITVFDDMVLDGWHRYKAAKELYIDFGVKYLDESIDPKDFVIAQNRHRRHITQAQLAMSATKVYDWFPHGGARISRGTECPLKSSAEIASVSGVSKRTVKQAKEVQQKAVSEVVQAVESGKIGLSKAVAIANLPKGQQAEAIDKPTPKPEVIEEIEEYTELDAANDQISELQADLVVARLGEVSDEQKIQAAEFIAELQAEIKTLKATLKAVNLSRDFLMEENSQMKKQMKMQRREIEKLKG
jgi:hypothetical protein